jgi:hypothetical protein
MSLRVPALVISLSVASEKQPERATVKNLVGRTSVDKNEVNMGFMPLAYPLLV